MQYQIERVLHRFALPMLKDLKETARSSIIYGLGSLSSKFVGLMLLPLYTHILTTSDYGMLGILETTGQFLVGMISVRIPASYVRWASDEEDPHKQRSYYFTSWMALIVVCITFCLIFLAFNRNLSFLFFDTEKFGTLFTILGISVSFEILDLLPLQMLRVFNRAGLYVAITTGKFLTTLVVNYVLIAKYNFGIEGVLIGTLSGNLLLWIATLPLQIKNSNLHFDLKTAYAMFKFGFPLIFSTISAMLLTMGDRYIIKHFRPYSELGLYTLAYKIGSVVNVFVINSFALGFVPMAFKLHKEPWYGRYVSKVLIWFTLIMCVCSLVLAIFSKEVIKIMASSNPDYWPAYNLVPFLLFAFIFKGIQYVLAIPFSITKGTRLDAFVIICGLALSVTLNFILIPRIGLWGAVVAIISAYSFMIVLTHRLAKKIMPLPYDFKRIAILLGSTVVWIGVTLLINPLPIWPRLGLKILWLALFPFFLWLIGFFEKTETRAMRKALKNWNKPSFWKDLMTGK